MLDAGDGPIAGLADAVRSDSASASCACTGSRERNAGVDEGGPRRGGEMEDAEDGEKQSVLQW